VISLFHTYPYLGGSLVLLGISLLALALCRGQWRPMLLSGLLAVPYTLGGAEITPAYWRPVRVAFFLTSPEDIMFAFAGGVLVWPIAGWPMRRRLVFRFRLSSLALAYLPFGLLAVALYLPCKLLGLPVMAAVMIPAGALWLLLVGLRPRLWPVALAGGICFPLLHLAVAFAVFRMWPHFLRQFNLANLSGILVLGVPLEELAWALAFGAVWPLVMACVFEARLVASPGRSVAPAR